ncbi:MAG: ABC transporter ATP-binding protein [bacterium]|nr:ABC transporter ATP-binding protein [bacterium]
MEHLPLAWSICPSAFIAPLFIAVCSAAVEFIPIYVSAYVLDSLYKGAVLPSIMRVVIPALLAVLLMHSTASLIGERNQLNIHTSLLEFRRRVSMKSMTMDYTLIDSPAVNDIRNKINNDDQWGNGIIGIFNSYSGIINYTTMLITAIVTLIPMLASNSISGTAGFISVAGLTVCALIPAVYFAKIRNPRYFKLMQENSSRKSAYTYFAYGKSINYKEGKDIRIFRADKLISGKIEDEEKSFLADWMRRLLRSESKGGLVDAVCQGGIVIASYLLVARYAIDGTISVGDTAKYASTMIMLSEALTVLASCFSVFLNSAKQQTSRLDFLKTPDVMRKGVIPVEKRDDNEYEFEFVNVSFKYPGSDSYALKNISLKFRIGEKLAVVGMNGSGKTTFIKLLCRLYDPSEGMITLNGIDIRRYKYNEYMDLFSVVFQDFKLFSFSIGDNIAAGNEVDTAKIMKCIDKAGLSERLKSLPNGIDTCLYKDYDENGVEISGGEAQKLAIARAVYKDAPFIILDEPTAALDPIAEYEIYSKFDEIAGDKTTVYISHRLSSCRFCDNIAVFDGGEIVERGSHSELLARNGRYTKLWNAQAQYYKD